MNRQLNRLAVVSIVLLGALVVGTTYWQTWAVAGRPINVDPAVGVNPNRRGELFRRGRGHRSEPFQMAGIIF